MVICHNNNIIREKCVFISMTGTFGEMAWWEVRVVQATTFLLFIHFLFLFPFNEGLKCRINWHILTLAATDIFLNLFSIFSVKINKKKKSWKKGVYVCIVRDSFRILVAGAIHMYPNMVKEEPIKHRHCVSMHLKSHPTMHWLRLNCFRCYH